MKKIFLIVTAALVLTACGGKEENNKHKELLRYLEKEDFDAAYAYIGELEEETESKKKDDSEEIELLSYVYGTWETLAENEMIPQEITFEKNKTCIVGDTECKWKVENEQEDSIHLRLRENGREKYICNFARNGKEMSMDLWIAEDEDNSNYAGRYINRAHYEIVELTTDNVNTYFEMKEEDKVNYNAFGDFEGLCIYGKIRLKENYQERLSMNNRDIVMEFTGTSGSKGCVFDETTKTYQLTEKYEVLGEDVTSTCTLYAGMSETLSGNIWSASLSPDYTEFYNYRTNLELTRVKGEIWLVKE